MTADASEQTPLGVRSPDPELKRLEPLLGKWRGAERTLDGVLGPGVPVTSTEEFYWLDGGYFLVSSYETAFGDEPVQSGVNYEGNVTEGKLTFEGPARFQYDLDGEGKIKLNPDGTLSVAWWLRDEDGAWRPWMNNTFTRTDRQP